MYVYPTSSIPSRLNRSLAVFHADPHAGNLLIRPAPANSRSPYNFEIALLDHGLYFDIDDELRLAHQCLSGLATCADSQNSVNYARFWLSLIAPPGTQTYADRRKYAELVGNIDPEMYPVFESAITVSTYPAFLFQSGTEKS